MSEAQNTAAAEKPAAKKTLEPAKTKAQPLMYVGPTVSGIAVQNTVYTEIPEAAKEAAADCPVFPDLFIPVMEYPKAEKQIREKSGRLYTAFCKAAALKKGGKS